MDDENGCRVQQLMNPKNIDFDIDDFEITVVVSYIVDVNQFDRTGQLLKSEKRKEKRRIKLGKSLKSSSNVSKVAGDVIRKCNFIPETRRVDLEKAILKLQNVVIRDEIRAETACTSNAYYGAVEFEEEKTLPQSLEDGPKLEHLSEYIEMLYLGSDSDQMEHKIEGTGKILALCIAIENLEQLVQDHAMMGALTRVIQDEYKKSTELNYNILRSFLAFSNFTEMHSILGNYKVGSITMKVLELEVQRIEHQKEQRKVRKAQFEKELRSISSVKAAELQKNHRREEAKDKICDKQQDKLLFVCCHILMNLAEDACVEQKMVKLGINSYLSSLLESSSTKLLNLVITALTKLSIFEENKNLQKMDHVALLCMKYVLSTDKQLSLSTLRLLFNLSFDIELRSQMRKNGLIPKLVELIKQSQHQSYCLRLLYQMSMDVENRLVFATTQGAVILLVKLVCSFSSKKLGAELAAIAINFTLEFKICELICKDNGVQLLVDKFMDTQDANLMKVIRNISECTYRYHVNSNNQICIQNPNVWHPHVERLCSLLQNSGFDNDDITIEIFGFLSNMTLSDFPEGLSLKDLMDKFDLIQLLKTKLIRNSTQKDLLLEAIKVIGLLAVDSSCAVCIMNSGVAESMSTVFEENDDEIEIRLQILFAVWNLLNVKGSRDHLLYRTGIVSDILEGIQSANRATRKISNQCLDIVIDADINSRGEIGVLAEEVKRQKFQFHNREYVMNRDYTDHFSNSYINKISEENDILSCGTDCLSPFVSS